MQFNSKPDETRSTDRGQRNTDCSIILALAWKYKQPHFALFLEQHEAAHFGGAVDGQLGGGHATK